LCCLSILVVAVCCFLTYIRLKEGSIPYPRCSRDYKITIAMGLLSVTIYQVCFMYGVSFTAAGDASLIVAFSPTITSILSVFLLNDPMTKSRVIGLICGLAGVGLVAWRSPNTQITVENRILGDMLVVGDALVYALYTVLMKRYLKQETQIQEVTIHSDQGVETEVVKLEEEKLPLEVNKNSNGVSKELEVEGEEMSARLIEKEKSTEELVELDSNEKSEELDMKEETSKEFVGLMKPPPKMSVAALVTWASIIGIIPLGPFSLMELPWNYSWSWTSFLLIAYLGIFSTFICYSLYAFGVQRIGAARTAIFSNAVPIFGVLSSALLLGESIGWEHGVALILVWIGVILVNYNR